MKTKPIIICAVILLCVTGCATDAQLASEASKYTSETAQAIATSGWKIAGSILGGLFLHALITG